MSTLTTVALRRPDAALVFGACLALCALGCQGRAETPAPPAPDKAPTPRIAHHPGERVTSGTAARPPQQDAETTAGASTTAGGGDDHIIKKPSKNPELPGYPSFADLVEACRPAVINIYTRTRRNVRVQAHPYLPHIIPHERVSESLGSGFIIDAEGLALTNHHVIKDASEIEVRLTDNRRFRARVIGADPKTDVALLQLEEAHKLPVLPLGDSAEQRVGEWVIAIGNPLGLSNTVTAGIVSALGRKNVPLNGELRYQDFIQTDASINPGNSGGPLLNTRGQVIGINTAISAEGQGIGFAIPMNMVKEILPQLKTRGHVQRSWLGVIVRDLPAAMRAEARVPKGGALITNLVPGGPGDAAKLQSGDVIVKVDGKRVTDANSLSWLAGNLGVGRRVPVEFMRDGKRYGTHLRLGSMPE